MGAAVQFFFSYPETGRKSLEEIEEMFRKGGPKPWKTKLGESTLDQRKDSVAAEQRKTSLGAEGKEQVLRADGKVDVVDQDDVNGVEHKSNV